MIKREETHAMPSGYTDKVQSGEVTEFPEFAMRCARAFGALITMRDDPSEAPVPEQFTPHISFYDDQIAAARTTLAEIPLLSTEECERRARTAHADALDAFRARQQERALHKARYEAMIAKVKAWTPPTAEHDELR